MLIYAHDEIATEVPNILRKDFGTIRYWIEKNMTDIPQLEKLGIKLQVKTKISTTSWADKKELIA